MITTDNGPTGQVNRSQRILDAAARAFAAHGYLAASLRDIAKEAGCSLTLLDHHFGNKADLLRAVVEGQHAACRKRMTALVEATALAHALPLRDFVERWVSFEFDLHATPQGKLYLMLMLRLIADQAVDVEVRRTLNCSEASVIKGFRRARPEVSTAALHAGWRLASAGLYALLTAAGERDPALEDASEGVLRTQAAAFVTSGLEAAWAPQVEVSAA
jgi:AcrR family transcriptional regulator